MTWGYKILQKYVIKKRIYGQPLKIQEKQCVTSYFPYSCAPSKTYRWSLQSSARWSKRSMKRCRMESVWKVTTQCMFSSFSDVTTAPSTFLYMAWSLSCRHRAVVWSGRGKTHELAGETGFRRNKALVSETITLFGIEAGEGFAVRMNYALNE